MDLEDYKIKLNLFNMELGITINWFESLQNTDAYTINLFYEGRFGIDLELKSPSKLMDEILLLQDSTLRLNACLHKSPTEIGIRDYCIVFEFI